MPHMVTPPLLLGVYHSQVRLQVQRQLAQALFKLSVDFRKQETRFLNKIEQQKVGGGGAPRALSDALLSSWVWAPGQRKRCLLRPTALAGGFTPHWPSSQFDQAS